MKPLLPFSIAVSFLLAAAFGVAAQSQDVHRVIAPQDIKWQAAPGLPPGAQVAVLFGDPARPEMLALRLKMPKGYVVPPHTHPTQEVITVMSGRLLVGDGATADRAMTTPVSAGGIFVIPANHPHYAYVDDDAEIQANGMGPFVMDYVNPDDDPLRKQ